MANIAKATLLTQLRLALLGGCTQRPLSLFPGIGLSRYYAVC